MRPILATGLPPRPRGCLCWSALRARNWGLRSEPWDCRPGAQGRPLLPVLRGIAPHPTAQHPEAGNAVCGELPEVSSACTDTGDTAFSRLERCVRAPALVETITLSQIILLPGLVVMNLF